MYKCVFGPSKVFATEVNDGLRNYLKQLKDQIDDIEYDNEMIKYIHDIEIELKPHKKDIGVEGDNDMIKNIHDNEIELKTYKKDIGIEGVQELHSELSGLLYHYQKAIPFEKTPYTQSLQPTSKYCFTNSNKSYDTFYKEIITEKWASEAVHFLKGDKTLTDKILDIYTQLDYRYQHPSRYSMKKLKAWTFTMGPDGETIENICGEKRTITTMFSHLVLFEDGIYNDGCDTRHWGLYHSAFYHIVMYKVLTKIVLEIETAIQLEK